MADLTLYTNPMSRGRVARWMLEETGQPYETVFLNFETDIKGADYLAINPMGKVPALTHGETVVTENAAICAYLADAFPEAGLSPPLGDRRRGPYFRWLFFTAGPLETAVTGKHLGLLASGDQKRMVGYGSFEDAVGTIETALSAADPYLTGDRFTAADLYVASFADFAINMIKAVTATDKVTRYIERCTDRPAYRRAAEIDNAALQELQPAQ